MQFLKINVIFYFIKKNIDFTEVVNLEKCPDKNAKIYFKVNVKFIEEIEFDKIRLIFVIILILKKLLI